MAQMRLLQTEVKGNFNKTETWLRKLLKLDVQNVLDKYGKVGVEALSRATPRRTGRTAESWSYSTEVTRGANGKVASASITWFNSNTTASNSTKNIPIVILHGVSFLVVLLSAFSVELIEIAIVLCHICSPFRI